MQGRWTEKNVDLIILAQSIEDYLKNKGFLTEKSNLDGGYDIFWQSDIIPRNLQHLTKVKISGVPNDFKVEIVASELMESSIRVGLLTKAFGGGYFALKNMKLKEKLEEMENEFWIFLEEKIANLEGSASKIG